MLTRFNFNSTRLMMVKIFGLSLGFQDLADFMWSFNNLSIITKLFNILNYVFKRVIGWPNTMNQAFTPVC